MKLTKAISLFLITAAFTAAHAATLATRAGQIATTEDFEAQHFMLSPIKQNALRSNASEIENTIIDVLAPRVYNNTEKSRLVLTPEEQRYQNLLAERAPLSAALNIVERRARAAFDASKPTTVERARELWAIDTKKYFVEEAADITQMFFDFTRRTFDETTARIKQAQAELAAGTSFDEVVQKYSDDAHVATSKGAYKGLAFVGSDPVMGRLIFKTLKPGEISGPTPSRVGFHIVRLDRKIERTKKPFDEVKGAILADMMEESAKAARVVLLEKLMQEKTDINKTAFDAFMIKSDPALEQKIREIDKNITSGGLTEPKATK